jgi:POTRA domain, ShlB-type
MLVAPRKVAVRVTGLYRDRGYFLARAYLPAQEIEGGIVRIAVLEGRYDSTGERHLVGPGRRIGALGDEWPMAGLVGQREPVWWRDARRS